MDWYKLVALLLVVYLVFWISRSIYRLYLHPLSQFPGPRVAAATTLYKAYIDIAENLSLVHELKRLHGVYGVSTSNPHG